MVCDLEPCNYLEMNMDCRHSDDNSKQYMSALFSISSKDHTTFTCHAVYNKLNERVHVFACERASLCVCVCSCVDWHIPKTQSSSIDASGIIGIAIVNIFNNQKRAHSVTHTAHNEHTKNYSLPRAYGSNVCLCILNEPQARERWTIDTFNDMSLSHVLDNGLLLAFFCFYFRDVLRTVLGAVLCLYGKMTMMSSTCTRRHYLQQIHLTTPSHTIDMIHRQDLMPRLSLSLHVRSHIVWRNTTLEFRSYKLQNYWNSNRWYPLIL